jgi:hypothetical protein
MFATRGWTRTTVDRDMGSIVILHTSQGEQVPRSPRFLTAWYFGGGGGACVLGRLHVLRE